MSLDQNQPTRAIRSIGTGQPGETGTAFVRPPSLAGDAHSFLTGVPTRLSRRVCLALGDGNRGSQIVCEPASERSRGVGRAQTSSMIRTLRIGSSEALVAVA